MGVLILGYLEPCNFPSNLTPKWQGPYTVILLTPTAAKLKEITAWVYITG